MGSYFDFTGVDSGSDILWGFTVNGGSKTNSGSENFLDGSFEFDSH